MPPRWPRQPDRNDPKYRRLDDRITFATHVALFAASNSGLWFFKLLGQSGESMGFPWAGWFTIVWLIALTAHGIYVLTIADYSK